MKSSPSVHHNIIANFAGKAWIGIFSLAFIPIYVKLMGVEVYGLIAIFTRMLWRAVERIDVEGLLNLISEPRLGNPFEIYLDGKIISQDLANSVLEYYSIRENFNASKTEKITFCELDAGYGRNAHVFITTFPKGLFYSKQWAISKNSMDRIVISKDDYPVPKNWKELYSRQAKVQVYFFEAMCRIDSKVCHDG